MDWKKLVAEHRFLSTYLRYQHHTESPKVHHMWSALACVSAALGRRFKLPFGNTYIYPNVYTILIGAPATRKSTAIRLAREMLARSTRVKFCATDTAGQKQGLLSSLSEEVSFDDDEQEVVHRKNRSLDTADFAHSWLDQEVAGYNAADEGTLFACASEFALFVGTNNAPMIACLSELWDCIPEYKYKLRKSEMTVREPTLQLLAATTPSQLVQCLPPNVFSQGLMSRIIMVYGESDGTRIPFPMPGSTEDKDYIEDVFGHCFSMAISDCILSPGAREALDEIYMSSTVQDALVDPRLQYYRDRRHDHLIKLLLLLVASDKRIEATATDVRMAHAILAQTETTMSDALGEYGVSQENVLRQRVLDFMQSQKRPMAFGYIFDRMSHDCSKRSVLASTLDDLVTSGKIMKFGGAINPATGIEELHYGVRGILDNSETKKSLLQLMRATTSTQGNA